MKIKWRATAALIMLVLAFWFEWNWVWAILFVVWAIPDIKSGVTYLMEPVEKKESPILYWAIILFWLSSAFVLLYLELSSL